MNELDDAGMLGRGMHKFFGVTLVPSPGAGLDAGGR